MTNQAVSKWASGTTFPDGMLLPDIASAFGMTIDALYGIERAEEKKVRVDDFPEAAYDLLLRYFYRQSGMHFTHIPQDENAQLSFWKKRMQRGMMATCLSDEVGGVNIAEDFAAINRRFRDAEDAKAEKENRHFRKAEIAAACEMEEDAVERALLSLMTLGMVERYVDRPYGRMDFPEREGVLPAYDLPAT